MPQRINVTWPTSFVSWKVLFDNFLVMHMRQYKCKNRHITMVLRIRTRNALLKVYILYLEHVSYHGKSTLTLTLARSQFKWPCQVPNINSLAQSWCCCWTAIAWWTGKQTLFSLMPSSITSLRISPLKFCTNLPQPLKSCSHGNLSNTPA